MGWLDCNFVTPLICAFALSVAQEEERGVVTEVFDCFLKMTVGKRPEMNAMMGDLRDSVLGDWGKARDCSRTC